MKTNEYKNRVMNSYKKQMTELLEQKKLTKSMTMNRFEIDAEIEGLNQMLIDNKISLPVAAKIKRIFSK